jgi:hypothetical protein
MTTAAFAIVLLAPLGQGQSIVATDDGWNVGAKSGAFLDNYHHNDNHNQVHTAVAEEPPGTVLTGVNCTSTYVGPHR